MYKDDKGNHMRDPARIQKVMAKVASLWYFMPDMRFGQLMEYIKDRVNHNVNPSSFFYIEDEAMMNKINEIIDSMEEEHE